jgi:hypothetical protein
LFAIGHFHGAKNGKKYGKRLNTVLIDAVLKKGSFHEGFVRCLLEKGV